MSEVIQFTTSIRAIQYTGTNLFHVLDLMGYDVDKQKGKINLHVKMPKHLPPFAMSTDFYDPYPTLTFEFTRGKMELVAGVFVMRIGDHITFMNKWELETMQVI